MAKQIGTGIVFLAVLAAAGAFFVAKAAPDPRPVAAALPPGDKPFARICKSDEVVDTRPDPAWVGQSFAGDNCQAPRIPATVDGFTASREQVMASIAEMKRYTIASEAFQRCVRGFIASRQAQANQDKKPMNMSLVIIENHRVIASENNKKKVADQVTATINAFNEYGSGCG